MANSLRTPVPGELRVLVTGSSASVVATAVRRFLDEDLPAVVEPKDPCHVLATVFVDYVPVRIEVSTYTDADDMTVAVFRHPTKSDIVRFRELFQRIVTFFRALDMQVSVPPRAWAGLIDDPFEDVFASDDQRSWSERVELVLLDAASPAAAMREQALQCLARWAESAPASHVAMAQGFAKHASKLGLTLLESPLAEMYPFVAMLRNVACGTSTEAQNILSNSAMFTVLSTIEVTGLPPPVARELKIAEQSLRKATLEFPKKPSLQNLKVDVKSCAWRDLASTSTRCTDLDSLDSVPEHSTLPAGVKLGRFVHSSGQQDCPPEVLQFLNYADNLFTDESTD